jgi:hypothetical protein
MNKNNDWPCYAEMPQTSDSYVRILHASPDAPAVDIYADGNLIARISHSSSLPIMFR